MDINSDNDDNIYIGTKDHRGTAHVKKNRGLVCINRNVLRLLRKSRDCLESFWPFWKFAACLWAFQSAWKVFRLPYQGWSLRSVSLLIVMFLSLNNYCWFILSFFSLVSCWGGSPSLLYPGSWMSKLIQYLIQANLSTIYTTSGSSPPIPAKQAKPESLFFNLIQLQRGWLPNTKILDESFWKLKIERNQNYLLKYKRTT